VVRFRDELRPLFKKQMNGISELEIYRNRSFIFSIKETEAPHATCFSNAFAKKSRSRRIIHDLDQTALLTKICSGSFG